MKPVITKIALINDNTDESKYLTNPIFNCIEVGPNDEAAGSFLNIKLTNDIAEQLQPGEISLNWHEWDALVSTVAQYREQWEWK